MIISFPYCVYTCSVITLYMHIIMCVTCGMLLRSNTTGLGSVPIVLSNVILSPPATPDVTMKSGQEHTSLAWSVLPSRKHRVNIVSQGT